MSPIQANDIAAAFTARLCEELKPDEFAAIAERNALLPLLATVCHSHDFCDANVYMAEAFAKVTGREIDLQSDADSALWAEAFTRFRFHGSQLGAQLRRIGLNLDHNGGNCFNWQQELERGLSLFCGDAESGLEPDDVRPVVFGVMLTDGGEIIAQQTHKTGAELAHVLSFVP